MLAKDVAAELPKALALLFPPKAFWSAVPPNMFVVAPPKLPCPVMLCFPDNGEGCPKVPPKLPVFPVALKVVEVGLNPLDCFGVNVPPYPIPFPLNILQALPLNERYATFLVVHGFDALLF